MGCKKTKCMEKCGKFRFSYIPLLQLPLLDGSRRKKKRTDFSILSVKILYSYQPCPTSPPLRFGSVDGCRRTSLENCHSQPFGLFHVGLTPYNACNVLAMPHIASASLRLSGRLSPYNKKEKSTSLRESSPDVLFLFYCMACSLTKVSLQQSFKSFAVSCLVSCHLMNGVMDCIKVVLLSTFCKVCFARSCAKLAVYSPLKVLLG